MRRDNTPSDNLSQLSQLPIKKLRQRKPNKDALSQLSQLSQPYLGRTERKTAARVCDVLAEKCIRAYFFRLLVRAWGIVRSWHTSARSGRCAVFGLVILRQLGERVGKRSATEA